MLVDVPDTLEETLREVLRPVLEALVEEKVEQRRTLLLTVADVADELRCSRASVLGLIRGGHLEAVRTGRTYRVASRTLEAYVDELTRPAHRREVVSSRTAPARPARRSADPAVGARRPATGATGTTVVAATRPPRPPRPKREKGPSAADVAESRCTVAGLADLWWGPESARSLVERSGVTLTADDGGPPTFRYGDLLDWATGDPAGFDAWAAEFDPVLRKSKGAAAARPGPGAHPAG